ncbi:MAG: MFS transporter, partial [Chloroflexota bacterium]|nr:MFS transporter [Chloroflexota bacterium]
MADGILDRQHRGLTLGIVMAITMVAFEGLALATVMPAIATDLQGLSLYGWIGSAFLLSQLVGSVWAGRAVDQRGLATPFLVSLVVFGAGLLVASFAPNMPVLLLGRALQGLGAGVLGNCVYTSINLGYEDALRPRMLAVISTAFVLPGMVGPYAAGLLAERLTWRSVFWALIPFLLAAGCLTFPAYRKLPSGGAAGNGGQLRTALLLASGTGLLLAGMGMLTRLPGWLLMGTGLVLVVPTLRRLLPSGTFSALPVLPATVAARGLFSTGFFTAETYVVLALTRLRGYPESTAGLMITAATLTWTASTWLHARLDGQDEGRGRRRRIFAGVAVLALGIIVVQPVAWTPNLVV